MYNYCLELDSLYMKIITPEKMAEDFSILHQMLSRVGWPDIRLAGPDTATLYSGGNYYSK